MHATRREDYPLDREEKRSSGPGHDVVLTFTEFAPQGKEL